VQPRCRVMCTKPTSRRSGGSGIIFGESPGGYPGEGMERRHTESSACRMFHRKVAEVMDGSRESARARSMALDLLDQVELEGVIKSINTAAGLAYIDCPETQALFSRELAVHRNECGDRRIGDRCSFRVRMERGQPWVYGLVDPSDSGSAVPWTTAPAPPPSRPSTAMSEVLTHETRQPEWSDAALEWKFSKEHRTRNGMEDLLAHKEGPGRSACEWKPSNEADDRRGIEAARLHKWQPEVYPAPQIREGTFIGWKSN